MGFAQYEQLAWDLTVWGHCQSMIDVRTGSKHRRTVPISLLLLAIVPCDAQ